MKILGLWRYPVKSLQGEQVEAAEVEHDGIAGDRRWGIRDEGTGRILTARRLPALLAASAAYDGDVPVITLPGGRTLVGPGADTDAALSEWVGRPVRLVAAMASDPGRAEYFADATDDSSEAIEWTMPVGRYVDAAAVLLLTTASLRRGAEIYPDGSWDVRRFRPNVLVAVADEGWAEDAWADQRLLAGSVALAPAQPCIRCTMVTRPQAGLDADVRIFRTLARNHHGHFGMWCDVAARGVVTIGDQVTVTATLPAQVGG